MESKRQCLSVAAPDFMTSNQRLKLIESLLERCNDLEKSALTDKIVNTIPRRDFIGELPPNIADYIISFLDYRAISKAIKISKKWAQRIFNSSSHWRKACFYNGASSGSLDKLASLPSEECGSGRFFKYLVYLHHLRRQFEMVAFEGCVHHYNQALLHDCVPEDLVTFSYAKPVTWLVCQRLNGSIYFQHPMEYVVSTVWQDDDTLIVGTHVGYLYYYTIDKTKGGTPYLNLIQIYKGHVTTITHIHCVKKFRCFMSISLDTKLRIFSMEPPFNRKYGSYVSIESSFKLCGRLIDDSYYNLIMVDKSNDMYVFIFAPPKKSVQPKKSFDLYLSDITTNADIVHPSVQFLDDHTALVYETRKRYGRALTTYKIKPLPSITDDDIFLDFDATGVDMIYLVTRGIIIERIRSINQYTVFNCSVTMLAVGKRYILMVCNCQAEGLYHAPAIRVVFIPIDWDVLEHSLQIKELSINTYTSYHCLKFCGNSILDGLDLAEYNRPLLCFAATNASTFVIQLYCKKKTIDLKEMVLSFRHNLLNSLITY